MEGQKPSPGRIVSVTLDPQTAEQINKLGGNQYEPGQKVPAMIVRVWDATSGTCNLKLFLDGPADLWLTSVMFSTDSAVRTWNWPERV